MHTYIPYLLPAVLVHVATGWLLFELLVRRLRPEIALGAALLYLSMGNAGASAVDASALGWTIAVPAIFLGLLAIERYEGGGPRRLALLILGAVVLSGTRMGFMVLFVLGVALIIRRLTNPRLKVVTTRMDLFVEFFLLAQILLGCWIALGYRW